MSRAPCLRGLCVVAYKQLFSQLKQIIKHANTSEVCVQTLCYPYFRAHCVIVMRFSQRHVLSCPH
jgi:hypothetical protein